jgi:hypothetical protein
MAPAGRLGQNVRRTRRAMPDTQDLVYRIDDRDEIVFVNPAWDEFARANDGAEVVSAAVLHRSLWDFVTDDTTRALYREMLKRTRVGRQVEFSFRCDSPDCRRFLEMQVTGRPDGGVEFTTRTVAEERRPAVRVLAPHAAGSDGFLRVCGWCNRVDADGEWVEVETAVARLGLFEESRLPRMTHGICGECYQKMSATLPT